MGFHGPESQGDHEPFHSGLWNQQSEVQPEHPQYHCKISLILGGRRL
jgi:hypothetical protein